MDNHATTKFDGLAAILVAFVLLMFDFGRPWMWLALALIAAVLIAHNSVRRGQPPKPSG